MRRIVAAVLKGALPGGVFVALIVASNALTQHFGLVAGLVMAGTFTAGMSLAARDVVRETAGLWAAVGCVVIGASLSFVLSGPALAVASGSAFLLAELADTAVYEPLRRAGRLRAVAVSQVVGAVVDSVVFLWLAGFPLWPAAGTQTVVKTVVVLLPLAALGGVYALLRDRFRTARA